MNLADQLAPVLALAAEKGVEVVPGWLRPWSGIETKWHDARPYNGCCLVGLKDDAAALIITGSLSAWLAGQGIVVCQMWDGGGVSWFMYRDGGHGWSPPDADSHLSALLAAATARLAELPNKENA